MRVARSGWRLFVVAAVVLSASLALAGSGQWNVNADGNWSDSGNWSGGTVADGAGATANFSGLNITANRTVTVDAGRTVGYLKFGDTSKTSYGQWWILTGNTLTLDTTAGTPTIETDVHGKGSGFAQISAPLAGDDGLILDALVRFDVASSYAGGTIINGGSVRLNADNVLGTDPITVNGGVMCAHGLNSTKTLANDVILANDLTFGYNGSSCPGTVKFTAVATITGDRTLRKEGYTTEFAGGISDGGNGYSLTIDLDPTPYSKHKFVLGGSTAYSGPTFVNGSTLQITGSMNTTTPYVEVNRGNYGSGTLSAYSDGDNDRIADDLPIYLQGGGITLQGPNTKYPVETLGTVTVRPSASKIQASPYRGVTQLTVADLVRDRGTVYFYAGTTASHTGPLGGTSGWRGYIYLTGQAEGYMGGWATAMQYTNSGYRDFCTYSAARGVEVLGSSVARPDQVEGAGAGSHVLTTAAQTTLSGNAGIASLVVQAGGDNDLGGHMLDLTEGGLLAATAYSISNGSLTSSAPELYLTALNGMTVDASLVGGMDVITTGSMTFGGANTATGELCVNSDTLTLGGTNSFMIITVAPGGTLDMMDPGAVTDSTVVNLLHSNPFGMLGLEVDVTVEALSLGGVWQPAGDYTANDLPDWLDGPGTLTVLSDGPQGELIPEPTAIVLILVGLPLFRRRRNGRRRTMARHIASGMVMLLFAAAVAACFTPGTAQAGTVWYDYPPNASPVTNVTDALETPPDIVGVRALSGGVEFQSGNTYSGGTVANGATVIINTTASPFGTGPLSLTSGTMRSWPTMTVANDVTLDGDYRFGYAGGSSYAGDITFSKKLLLNGNYTLSHYGTINNARPVLFGAGIGDGGNGYNLTIGSITNNSDGFRVDSGSTYTGATTVNGSYLAFIGALTTTSSVTVNTGGTFNITKYDYSTGKSGSMTSSIPVTVQGGTLYTTVERGSYSSSIYTQTFDSVTVPHGASMIRSNAKRGRMDMTIGSLDRQGGTVYFYDSMALNASARARIFLTGQLDGPVGGWAAARQSYSSMTQTTTPIDLAYYSSTDGVVPLLTRLGARTPQLEGAGSSSHVEAVAAQTTLTGDTDAASLVVRESNSHDLGGNKLDILGGGLLHTGTAYTMSNGTLTSSSGELVIHSYGSGVTVNAVTADEGGALAVTTRGNVTLGGNNTATGDLDVCSGTLSLTGTNSFMIITVAPGGTLDMMDPGAVTDSTVVNLLHSNPFGMLGLEVDVTVEALSLDGVWQAAGDYTTNDLPDWLDGPGTLTVLSDGPQGELIPEPTVIGLAGLVLLRRRRRK